jgi:hypothetical protein
MRDHDDKENKARMEASAKEHRTTTDKSGSEANNRVKERQPVGRDRNSVGHDPKPP